MPTTRKKTRDDRAPEGVISRALRLAWPVAVICAVVFAVGFAWFAERVSAMGKPSAIEPANGIVVLTGGQSRIEAALDLLSRNKGERLLISGVNPGTTKTALRNALGADENLFKCCVDIGYQAQDTVGNAEETITWIRSHGYHSLILVTNNYHMARSLLELQRLDPRLHIEPYPVVNSDLTKGKWMMNSEVVRVLFSEYVKYLGAVSRRVLPVPSSIASMTGT